MNKTRRLIMDVLESALVKGETTLEQLIWFPPGINKREAGLLLTDIISFCNTRLIPTMRKYEKMKEKINDIRELIKNS